MRANFTPKAEPWLTGLTTSGKCSRSAIAGSACAAPSSLKAVSLNARKSGVGMSASAMSAFATTLSKQRTHAAGGEPV